MELLTIIFLAVLVGYSAAENPVDYRIPLAASCTPRVCSSPGPLCQTCTSLVACVEDGENSGNYSTDPLATCDGDTPYCIDGQCSDVTDPFCSNVTELAFVCNRTGIFPDPFYHNKFVLCVKEGSTLKAYLNECEDDYSFNIANDLCSAKVDNAGCPHDPYPVPLCEYAGQTDAIKEKPAMYYLCRERTYNTNKVALYPYLFICSGGAEYDKYQCGDSDGTTLPTTATT